MTLRSVRPMASAVFDMARCGLLLLACVVSSQAALAVEAHQIDPSRTAAAQSGDTAKLASAAGQAEIDRGAYLARASDCIACHTAKNGKAFGGGYPIATPFGTIYGSNISADRTYGIGDWTDAQFVAAVRHGVGRHGENLYPAMPYDSFIKMRPDDVLAIKAYLMSLPPVHTPTPALGVKFPFNQRWTLWFWKLINVKGDVLEDDAGHDAQWNRGRYMVEALAHCQACHTPRNITLGMDTSRAFGGSDLGAWRAYNITPDKTAGIGDWTDAELVTYLRNGDTPGRASAAGPMGEAVEHSLQYLNDDDLKAMVAYLRTVPALPGAEKTPRSRQGHPASDYEMLRGADAQMIARHAGAQMFLEHCATCHGATGAGKGTGVTAYPSLFDHSAVGASTSTNMVSVILSGVQRDMHGIDEKRAEKQAEKQAGGKTEQVFMPSFAHELSDEQIATLANYLSTQFGDPSVRTTATDVAKLRTIDMKPYPDLQQADK